MKTRDYILNLFYPPQCLACGEILPPDWAMPVCLPCREEWAKLMKSPCAECGRPHPDCRCLPPSLIDLRAEGLHLVPYEQESVAGRLLLIAKEERLPILTSFFAEQLEMALSRRCGESEVREFLLTYLPRSRNRAATSGVDPSLALAKELGWRLDLPVLSLYQRRNAPQQKELSASERLRSARRTYRLKKHIPSLAGKTVLLVDDIFTTGATMLAGVELLRANGAKRIICLTVGKTPNHTSKGNLGVNL